MFNVNDRIFVNKIVLPGSPGRRSSRRPSPFGTAPTPPQPCPRTAHFEPEEKLKSN